MFILPAREEHVGRIREAQSADAGGAAHYAAAHAP